MARHPTVLHVSQPTDGGVARFVTDIVRAQARAGWRVAVAAPVDADFQARLTRAGASHHPWCATRDPGPRTSTEVRALRRIMRAVRPDALHLHSSKAGLAGRVGGRGIAPIIFQPHAWSFEAVDGAQQRLSLVWERVGARRADALLCVSNGERRRAAAAGVHGPFRVIHNGIDLDHFTPVDDARRAAAKRELGVERAPLVVCVGRLCRQKGQDVLLRAWPRIARVVPAARLALVGDGPDRALLEARAPSGVRFAGHASDPRAWLAAADVVAIPSRWEAMPYALLEAMASGRCVVGASVDGIEEAAADAAAVVPPDDPGALAAAIVTRLTDSELAAKEGRLARERVERDHDANHQLALVSDLTRELIGAHAGS